MSQVVKATMGGLCVGLALLTVTSANAQELRYTTNAPGGIAAAGNALGLSNQPGINGPGLNGSIGTFIAANPSDMDLLPLAISNPWGEGTTNDWNRNGSSAVLDLPQNAQVKYAELVWAGSYQAGGTDVSSELNTPVTLSFGSDTLTVTPDPASAITLSQTGGTGSGFPVRYYLRSSQVTSFVAAHGAGSYMVGGVPATQSIGSNSLNAAGWSLVVAYRADNQRMRNLSIFVGGSFVDEDDVQDYAPEGFCAPPFGPVEGRVVVSAVEGDANITGDSLSIGASASGPFVSLSGPNNPASNVFASQINDAFGMLDTRGSFGTVNHNAITGTHTAGGRQSWDLTAIELSNNEGHLSNAQTGAVLRAQTEGDSFFPVLLAFEIDANAPDFGQSQATVQPSRVSLGDTLTVTATLDNSGEAPANDLGFSMAVDSGLSLRSYSTNSLSGDSTGATVTTSRLSSGVPAGNLPVDNAVEVSMVFDVVGPPNSEGRYVFTPVWSYSFVTCEGESAIRDTYQVPAMSSAYDDAADPDPDTEPDTDPVIDTDIPADTGDDAGINIVEGGRGHCGCASSTPSVGWGLSGLSVLGLLGLRRRRATKS